MDGVFLDTHALIWYLSSPEFLSTRELHVIDSNVKAGNKLYISSITIVEIIYLVEKNRIPQEAYDNLMQAVHDPSTELYILPIDEQVAAEITNISRESVPDMPDRLIAATAKYYDLTLLTRDQKIRDSGVKVI